MRAYTSIKIGLILLCLISAIAFIVPLISSYEPFSTALHNKNQAPSHAHLFGTDDLGRDLLVRVCSALQLSLTVGALASIVDLCIGLAWGMTAALSISKVDNILMGIANILYSIPYLLVVLLLTVIAGQGFTPIFFAMVFVGWIQMARIVRAQTKNIMQMDYITSARIIGASPLRVFFHHMIPNMLGPILAATVLSIPQAIFSEAFLSFLGIGIQPPQASLGSLVADALPALRFYPWRLFFPAGAITLLVLSITLISDGLRDLYDPKKRLEDSYQS